MNSEQATNNLFTGRGRPNWRTIRDKSLICAILGLFPILLPFIGVYKGPNNNFIKLILSTVTILIGIAVTMWYISQIRRWLSSYSLLVTDTRIKHTEAAPWMSVRTEIQIASVIECDYFTEIGESADRSGYVRLTTHRAIFRLEIGSYPEAKRASMCINSVLANA